ncbi:hypothetical protein OG747_40725 [Streptomyces sp. NBC_01384]|uniref:hypothetical protein n=1 Tax=Streptomyces sp. NBC_01384 TaxID=2903847 RepID=UPI0032494D05
MSDAPLHLVPVRSRQAKDFVRTWHRHHPPPARQIFAVGAASRGASTLAARITDAQQLSSTALRLFLALSPQASRPSPPDLLLLHQVAQIAKAAQDAAAEWAVLQQELGAEENAEQLEEGVPDGCSPWACRGSEPAVSQDDFGLTC